MLTLSLFVIHAMSLRHKLYGRVCLPVVSADNALAFATWKNIDYYCDVMVNCHIAAINLNMTVLTELERFTYLH